MRLKLNANLAELVGILLGDGSFYLSGYNNEVDIALDTKDEKYKTYVKSLLERITSSYIWEKHVKSVNCVHIRLTRKLPTLELLKVSFKKSGNKIKNKVTIPDWIWKKDIFLKSCIRGLIDTDGSIYRLKPQWPNLFQLSFKNNNILLLKDVRKAFLSLGFHPSKVFGNRVVITRQMEIRNYFINIGTRNDTHLKEHNLFFKIYTNTHDSPVV
jgi:intein/homing endonuclease